MVKDEVQALNHLPIPSGAAILVTGGAGFIGSNICHRLAGRGARLRVLDNLSTGSLANLEGIEGQVDFLQGDLADLDVVRQATKGVDFVLHQGALPSVPRSIDDPLASHAANATGTLNVLLASTAAGVKRVVYASSSSVYGNSTELPKREDMPLAPISPYAAAKLAGEHYCQAFFSVHRLEVVVLRYFNVFGPRQNPFSAYAAVIPRFVTSLLTGERPTIYGDGDQSRDFTYVDNVVEANLLALQSPEAAGRVFNIACQKPTTLNQLLAILQRLIGVDVPACFAPPRPGDLRHSLADISLARKLLRYAPTITTDEGLRSTVRYWAAAVNNPWPGRHP